MNELIVATYNILFGNNTKQIIENIKKMADEGVNLFCLQEVINKPNEVFIIDQMLKSLGKNWQAEYHVGTENSKLSIGTAIIWDADKLKLKQTEKILLPKIKKFDINENLFYKIIGHAPFPLQRRAIVCYLSIDQTLVRVTCLHADNVGGPKHRLKQIRYVTSCMQKLRPVDHEIICGDFNTFDLLKTGYEKRLLHKIFGEKFIDASEGLGWTSDIQRLDFRTSMKIFSWFIKTFRVHIRRKLDYIWVKNFEVVSCRKWDLPGSDHLPLIAKLTIN